MTFDLHWELNMLRLRSSWIDGTRQLVRTTATSRASSQCPVHPDLLKVLVCPLSKEPLRYDPSTNELVCDKLGVAYPILENGLPNLMPEDGRLLHSADTTDQSKSGSTDLNNITPSSVHSEPQT